MVSEADANPISPTEWRSPSQYGKDGEARRGRMGWSIPAARPHGRGILATEKLIDEWNQPRHFGFVAKIGFAELSDQFPFLELAAE